MKKILVVKKEAGKAAEKVFIQSEFPDFELFKIVNHPFPASFPDEVFVGDDIIIFSTPYGESRGLPLVNSIAKPNDIYWVQLYGVVYIVKRIKGTYDLVSMSEDEADFYCHLFRLELITENMLSENKGAVRYNIH